MCDVVEIRRRFWILFLACALIGALILAAMPPEKTIGQVVKIVYLHGALSRAGLVGIAASSIFGLAYLLYPRDRSLRWSSALLMSGWAFWAAHFIVSIPATRLTWGPWIAWGEPRVTMTLQVIGAGLAVLVIDWLLCTAYFTAAANTLLGSAVFFLAGRTGVLRHPLDPIGGSPSSALRFSYLMLLIPIIIAMALTAWRLSVSPAVACRSADEPMLADQRES